MRMAKGQSTLAFCHAEVMSVQLLNRLHHEGGSLRDLHIPEGAEGEGM